MERDTPVKTLSTTMSAEPVSAETFNRFRTLARTAADIAATQPNPNIRVSWFIGFVNDMNIDQFSSDDMNAFFQRFPDEESITQPEADENVRAINVCRKLDLIIITWISAFSVIYNLVNAFEARRLAEQRVIQAVPTIEPPMPVTQPVAGAGATPTEGTAGTAEGTRPARPSITYEYRFQNDRYNIASLDEYIRLGHIIKNGPDFENSVLRHLEKFLIGGSGEVKGYLGNSHFSEIEDPLAKTFYAIAAPSLEGKTQAAFVFRDVKPLYFVIPRAETGENAGLTQTIYKNFLRLSYQLNEFAQKDLVYLRQLNNLQLGQNLTYEHISVSTLSERRSQEGFYVLGFLKALIMDCRDNYRGTDDQTWIRYYVSTNRRLDVTPTSIDDFGSLEVDIREFCLFLDEFTGEFVNVLIRNQARAANLKVIVANTNAKITNLVGTQQAVYSRVEINAWAVVFTRLDNMNSQLLSAMVRDLDDLKNDLFNKVEPRDLPDLEAFFVNFETIQVKNIRPGFVHLILAAMRTFNQSFTDQQFSFNTFLSRTVDYLGEKLKTRKPGLSSDPGLIGTKALYFSNAYGSALDTDVRLMSHRKQYLDCHFYYLINPVDPSKFCFLTYPPGALTGSPVLSEGSPCLELCLGFNKGILGKKTADVWAPELTIFEENEILPFLAFLGLWHDLSIPNILRKADSIAQVRGSVNMPNPEQNVPRSGNSLEVLSAVCSINASHRDLNSREITFTGQSCKDFLANLILNLISADYCRSRINDRFVFPSNRNAPIFDRIHVPFLFPANLSIPEDFWNSFSAIDPFRTHSIHLGTFKRTVDRDEIDAKFDLFVRNVSGSGYTRGTCTIECKNLNPENNLGLKEVTSIMVKAQRNRADLGLLICNKIVSRSSEPKHFEDLKAKCLEENWNLLRLVKIPTQTGNIFRIQQYHSEYRLRSPIDYKMTFIILELNTINS